MSFVDFWAPVAPLIGFFAIIVLMALLGVWLEKLRDRANHRRYADWLEKNPGSTYRDYLKDQHS